MRVDEDWWNPVPLGFDRGVNAHPAWSPDGSRIAFVSDWRAYDILYDLFVMNADGSDVRLLLGGPFFGPGRPTTGSLHGPPMAAQLLSRAVAGAGLPVFRTVG